MSNFFSVELKKATEKELNSHWLCSKKGEYFRCCFCGHKFILNDLYRVLYTNDIKNAGGNPIVCEKCNDTTENLRETWKAKCKFVYNDSFWWFFRA